MINIHYNTQKNTEQAIPLEIKDAISSFKSFIHKTYIKDQSCKELVEKFLSRPSKIKKYQKIIAEYPIQFYSLVDKAIKRKRKMQT